MVAGATGTYTLTGIVKNNYPVNTPICLKANISSTGENGSTGNNILSNVCYTV